MIGPMFAVLFADLHFYENSFENSLHSDLPFSLHLFQPPPIMCFTVGLRSGILRMCLLMPLCVCVFVFVSVRWGCRTWSVS